MVDGLASEVAALGVAVSGGGDSMALLHLLAGRPGVQAVTVDHGLRPEAATEAAGVAMACAALGVPHTVLHWLWDGTGNLSDRARQGRMRLMAGWARARGISAIALGHTADDQAETFLMRLARGSGVDGLSGMAQARQAEGIEWLRPLLGARRSDLRNYLNRHGIGWFEDPTNTDEAYLRVRARAALVALEPLGITVEGLVDTAQRLLLVRGAMQATAHSAARQVARIAAGDVVFDRAGLWHLPMELQLRLLAHAICWISQAIYRPRFAALTRVHAGLVMGKRQTLGGCLLTPTGQAIRITREQQAVAGIRAAAGAVWDGRWIVSGPDSSGLEVAALGAAGLALCPGWRSVAVPRSSLVNGPAVWRGDVLIAAPLAGFSNGWQARLLQGADSFFAALLSH